jgi:hypothetical protein
MKINGSGLPKGPKMLKVSLPNNLKKAWPDLNRYSSISFDETLGVKTDLSPILHLYNIQKHEKILDIGAFKNEVVETLQADGFHKAVGIDVNSDILRSKYGRHINFRDLQLNETYRVIYFSLILSHFESGLFDEQKPSMQLFANKIYLHLLPKGYLIFRDMPDYIPKFTELLLSIGFRNMFPESKRMCLFEKE